MTASSGTTGTSDAIRWERDADGVVTLTLDAPGQFATTLDTAFAVSLAAAVERLEAEADAVRGVIVTSAKETFLAGGDLRELLAARPGDARRVFDSGMALKASLRRLETLGRPVVAAINGTALGGGLELALACHHRIVLDAPGCRIGLPEVTLGLLPGAGGVTRTVRLLGVADALRHVLLTGQRHRPARAVELGLVHETAGSRDEMLRRARAFIGARPGARQPWDEEGYRIPGGTPADPAFAAALPAFPATLRKQLNGAPYPAPRAILAAAVEGAQVGFETAQTIEARYFTELVTGQTAKNMIQGFFFDRRAVESGARRPAGIPERIPERVGVLGAGMMGAGIAGACARAGLHVVLRDVTAGAAERGRDHVAGLLDRAVARGRTTPDERERVLARITATADPAALAGCDTVIEAVPEDAALKHTVFQEAGELVAPGALLCSGTSTLPVSRLADSVRQQENFLGLHFFSPVHRMPLVEIVRGERTGEEALARAVDLVRLLGKTPLMVNDSPGFFTSRVVGQFLDEGVALVGEGVDPATVEQAAAQAGYPAKVLALMDELTLTLPRSIRRESRAAAEAAGSTVPRHPAEEVVDRMIDEFGRPGRSGGAGFYDYADGRRTRLWPGLRTHFTNPGTQVPWRDLQERMLFAEALESVRLLQEGVLLSVADANVGSLLGIGFPGWTGGVLQYINGYPGGTPGFAARAGELRARYGDRFTPPALLADKAAKEEMFTDS